MTGGEGDQPGIIREIHRLLTVLIARNLEDGLDEGVVVLFVLHIHVRVAVAAGHVVAEDPVAAHRLGNITLRARGHKSAPLPGAVRFVLTAVLRSSGFVVRTVLAGVLRRPLPRSGVDIDVGIRVAQIRALDKTLERPEHGHVPHVAAVDQRV